MATAVLPLYLATIGLGPAALGIREGLADFPVSLAKLGGGVVGHHARSKRPWAVAGYLVTTLCIGAMGFAQSLAALVGLRTAAWTGRGLRGPLRDYLLSAAVEPSRYGRAYGLERAGDMLGAVAGLRPSHGSRPQVSQHYRRPSVGPRAGSETRAQRRSRTCHLPAPREKSAPGDLNPDRIPLSACGLHAWRAGRKGPRCCDDGSGIARAHPVESR